MLTIPRRINIVLAAIHRALEHMECVHDARVVAAIALLHQSAKAILVFPEEYISSDDSMSVIGLVKAAVRDIIIRFPSISNRPVIRNHFPEDSSFLRAIVAFR